MKDFDKLISSTLIEQADHAPVAVGLAQGARLRHRRRRQRVAVGVAAGALTIAAPLALALSDRGDAPDDRSLYAADPTSTPSSATGWQRIEENGVSVEIPSQWRSFECANQTAFPSDEMYGPNEEDACSLTAFASFADRDQFEVPDGAPGKVHRTKVPRVVQTPGPHDVRWSGHLYAGDQIFGVVTAERSLTSHILDSATGTDLASQRREPIRDAIVYYLRDGQGLEMEQASCVADSLMDADLSEKQLKAVPDGVNLMIPEGESDWRFVFNDNGDFSRGEVIELNAVLSAQATECLQD